MGTEEEGFPPEPDCLASAPGVPPEPPSAAEAQLAIARAALRRLSLIDEMAGWGQRDDDPEATARCRYAAGTLETMDRLAEPGPPEAASVRAEVLASIAADWTIDPSTGHSNSSEEFRRLAAEVERILRVEFRVVRDSVIAGAADMIMAQLANVHGLAPRAPLPEAGDGTCDDIDDSVVILEAATESLTSAVVPAEASGRVIVSRDDLCAVLEHSAYGALSGGEAWLRLAAAARLEAPPGIVVPDPGDGTFSVSLLATGNEAPPADPLLLSLSTRVRNALIREGYRTAAEVAASTADDLLDIRNFGDAAVTEVREALAAAGLTLRDAR